MRDAGSKGDVILPGGRRESAGAPGRPVIDASAAGAVDVYRALVDSITEYAIYATDPAGRIRTWNQGAQRITAYTADEVIGRDFSIMFTDDDIAAGAPAAGLATSLREGWFEETAWRVRKCGTHFRANVVITPVRCPVDGVVGYAIIMRDMTDRENVPTFAIEQARRLVEAEAANQARTEFLAAMSHELRTPLNAIGGYVDLISLGIRGPVTEQQIDDLKRIRRSQQHLLGIINDLLNFSRIEAGRVNYDMQRMPLRESLDVVRTMIEPLAAVKNLTMKWPVNVQVTVHADRMKVEQILMNVLTNAVKFTPAGGRITVSCTSRPNRSTIEVTDTGSGIAPEKLQSIFEPFVQIGRSHTSPHEGTGLGLAISRDLARAMGGDLTVRSEPGVGSTFSLVVLREPATPIE